MTTDDLGAFRFYNLPPGRYYVAARSWGAVLAVSRLDRPRAASNSCAFFLNAVDRECAGD